jgi:hypothetical protein
MIIPQTAVLCFGQYSVNGNGTLSENPPVVYVSGGSPLTFAKDKTIPEIKEVMEKIGYSVLSESVKTTGHFIFFGKNF